MSSSLKNDYGYFSSKILDEILLEKYFKNKNPNARLGLTSEDYQGGDIFDLPNIIDTKYTTHANDNYIWFEIGKLKSGCTINTHLLYFFKEDFSNFFISCKDLLTAIYNKLPKNVSRLDNENRPMKTINSITFKDDLLYIDYDWLKKQPEVKCILLENRFQKYMKSCSNYITKHIYENSDCQQSYNNIRQKLGF